MNEQIKKLYEQSFVRDNYVNMGPDGPALGFKFDPEKFAELVVRECAEVLDIWNKENGAEEGLDKAGLISLWSPHFGVEE